MSETQTPSDEDFMRAFNDLQRKVADISNAAVGGASLVTGDIVGSFASSRSGCLLCDGSTIADIDYGPLAAYIRANLPAAYVVDGSHVKLPDYRGAALAGSDGATFILGTETGTETVTLTGAQSGTSAHGHPAPTITIGNEASHTHVYVFPSSIAVTLGATNVNAGSGTNTNTSAGSSHTHSGSSSAIANSTPANATTPHSSVQPTLPTNWFIKT